MGLPIRFGHLHPSDNPEEQPGMHKIQAAQSSIHAHQWPVWTDIKNMR